VAEAYDTALGNVQHPARVVELASVGPARNCVARSHGSVVVGLVGLAGLALGDPQA
jgi:hypothetical protein